jgi:AsmA family protein
MTTFVDVQQPIIVAIATPDGERNYVLPSRHVQADAPRITDGHAHGTLAGLRADVQVAFSTQTAPDADHRAQIVATADGTYAALPTTARLTWDAALRSGNDAQPSHFILQVRGDAARSGQPDPRQSDDDHIGARHCVAAAADRRHAAVDACLRYADGLYHITDTAGRVGQSDLEGTITVRTGGNQPLDVTAALSSRDATIDDLGAAIAGQRHTDSGIPPRSASRLFSTAPLRLPQLDGGALHLTYHAQTIRGASTTLSDLGLHAELAGGALTLQPFGVDVGRGKLTGDFRLAPQPGGALRGQADVLLDGVGLAHFVAQTKYQAAGTLNGAIHRTGTGDSVATIFGAADGAASLWMQQGDVSAVLVELAGLQLGSALLTWLSGPQVTRVQCFVADLPLRHGVITTRAVILETTDLVLQGSGSANLTQERMEIRLRTQSKHFAVGVFPVLVLISDPFADPRTEPDPFAAASHGLGRVLSILPRVELGADDTSCCEAIRVRLRKGIAAH